MKRDKIIRCDKQTFNESVRKKLLMSLAVSDMTMKELAEVSGIPYSTLYNILRRKYAASLFCTAKLCTVFNIDANWLLGIKRKR